MSSVRPAPRKILVQPKGDSKPTENLALREQIAKFEKKQKLEASKVKITDPNIGAVKKGSKKLKNLFSKFNKSFDNKNKKGGKGDEDKGDDSSEYSDSSDDDSDNDTPRTETRKRKERGSCMYKTRKYLTQVFIGENSTQTFFLGTNYTVADKDSATVRKYNLKHWYQRLFTTLEHSESCILGNYIYQIIMTVILVNVIANVFMTLPQFRRVSVTNCTSPACDNDPVLCPGTTICEPVIEPLLTSIDDVCVIIFTLEYMLRMLTIATVPNRIASLVDPVWDEQEMVMAEIEQRAGNQDPPNMPWYAAVYNYFWSPKNVIDFVAILPFYITLLSPGANASLSFVRILRLLRVVRAFNSGANLGVINMLVETIRGSVEVMVFIFLIGGLFIFIFGSIIFDVEGGTFVVTTEHPTGSFVRMGLDGELNESPFTSSLMGMYWAVVTMTTVGYGDVYPVSNEGRMVAVTCMIVGMLFMSLPIAIIGSKVTLEYTKLENTQAAEKVKRKSIALEKRVTQVSGKTVSRALFQKAIMKVQGNRRSSISIGRKGPPGNEEPAYTGGGDSMQVPGLPESDNASRTMEVMTTSLNLLKKEYSVASDKYTKQAALDKCAYELEKMADQMMSNMINDMKACKSILTEVREVAAALKPN